MTIEAQKMIPNRFGHNYPIEEIFQDQLMDEVMEKVREILKPYIKDSEEYRPDGTILKSTLVYDVRKIMVSEKIGNVVTAVPKTVITFFEPVTGENNQ